MNYLQYLNDSKGIKRERGPKRKKATDPLVDTPGSTANSSTGGPIQGGFRLGADYWNLLNGLYQSQTGKTLPEFGVFHGTPMEIAQKIMQTVPVEVLPYISKTMGVDINKYNLAGKDPRSEKTFLTYLASGITGVHDGVAAGQAANLSQWLSLHPNAGVQPGGKGMTGRQFKEAQAAAYAAQNPTNGPTSQPDPSAQQMYTSYENVVNQYLDVWGLGPSGSHDLSDQLFEKVTQNHWINQKELLTWVRSTDEYKQTFPGLNEHNADPTKNNMTEADYMNYRNTAGELAGQYGLPAGFMTKDRVAKLVEGGVSTAELSERFSKVATAVNSADKNVLKALGKMGVDTGHLAAYYLDPKNHLKEMEKTVTTAQMMGFGADVGLTGASDKLYRQIATQARGLATGAGQPYDLSQARAAIQSANKDISLTRSAAGAGGTSQPIVSTAQLVGSQMAGVGGGNMIKAQQAVQRAEQARIAPFQKGGGYVASIKGVEGAGVSKA